MPSAIISEHAHKPLFILNGPNLDRLGTRQPEIYGHETLDEVMERCAQACTERGLQLTCRQTSHEGMLIDWVHEASDNACGLAINAGGLSHSSIALADALRLCTIPVIEVHISNIAAREAFRAHSVLSPAVQGVIFGLGTFGYVLAVAALAEKISMAHAS